MSDVLEQPEFSVESSDKSHLVASFMVAHHKSNFDAVHDSFGM